MTERCGGLVIVGTGIQLGRDVTERVVSEIRHAEVVLALVDPWAGQWLQRLRPDAISLMSHYAPDRDRRDSYAAMVADILDPVRAGRRVCAVFYGHPAVFADVPHDAARAAVAEGHAVRILPAVSAEACLYADLGLDPGANGVISIEATQFLTEQRVLDPCSLVLLWQVALAGSLDCKGFEPSPQRLQVLVGKLTRWYRPDHEVILYEAARLAIEPFRAERIRLGELPGARFCEYTTLVIPPAARPAPDREIIEALRAQ
ncbi:MAG: SAM-dependent methyltransferase [Wenzhouxiangellaceae bacterium]